MYHSKRVPWRLRMLEVYPSPLEAIGNNKIANRCHFGSIAVQSYLGKCALWQIQRFRSLERHGYQIWCCQNNMNYPMLEAREGKNVSTSDTTYQQKWFIFNFQMEIQTSHWERFVPTSGLSVIVMGWPRRLKKLLHHVSSDEN